MRLKDKIALVTGAAHGIGLAIAHRFAAEGARLVLVDVDMARGEAAAAEFGPQAMFLRADVGDAAAAAGTVDAAAKHFGGLDILVNNAAIIHGSDFLELKESDFDRVLRVNLKGAFLMGQAAARLMVGQGRGGSIVNLSSVNAVMAIPNQTPYCVAKGGLNQLTKVMALSLAPHRIRVNAVGPGSIMTDMLKNVMNDEAAKRKILSRTPLGRCGEPEEVAAVVAFLASDEASYMTGQCLYPDGGRLALNYTMQVD